MKALILNSGLGRRMGDLTLEQPKCMTNISSTETILSHQLHMIAKYSISNVIITTGYFDEAIIQYCTSLNLPLRYSFVNNPLYKETNYIYSIYCAREYLKDDDILLMHGDLVFEKSVLDDVINCEANCMVVSSTQDLLGKDFKAMVVNGKVVKIGIEISHNAMAAQPLYKLNNKKWTAWLERILFSCENNRRNIYAEDAFNEVSEQCILQALDIENSLCQEIDTPEDLALVSSKLHALDTCNVKRK